MAVEQKKVNVADLSVGMYISKLDIPWVQSPFPIQGFFIRSADQIALIEKHCRAVLIDVVKSQPLNKKAGGRAIGLVKKKPRAASVRDTKKPENSSKRAKEVATKPLPLRLDRYPIALPAKKELKAAKHIQRQVVGALGKVLAKVKSENQLDVELCGEVSKEVVNSVLRNPDALMWVTQLQQHNEMIYSKSINSLVWSLVFGRHLGLDRNRLELLSSAMLLGCIGMTRLPVSLLAKKSPLGLEEAEEYKKYVDYSVDMLRAKGHENSALAEVVASQQERHDGSGYPKGIMGDEICLLGKIAGLVGYFDSLLLPLHGEPALTTTEACAEIYGLKGIKFQGELVDEFISAISIYPTGSLVELTTEEIGIIVSRHEKRKLLPKVLIIFDSNRKKLSRPKVLDLLSCNKNRDQFVAIKKSLRCTEWDVDLSEYVIYKESGWLSMVM